MKKSLTLVLLIGLILLNFSCKKSDLGQSVVNDTALKNKNLSTNATGIPSYPLDWENISFMPTPPNVAAIPVPWQSGLGGVKINQDMIYDYAKSDGWELVYNTFNTSTVYSPSYFMLYNKYRGVLRTYFYFAPGQNYPSNNIVSELLINGAGAASSPALNFSGTDIVDYGTNQLAVTQLQPYQVSTTGSWYASEFELAYDKNTATTAYPSTTMEWQINPNSIASITLNGTQAGSLNGTIAVPGSKTNFFGTLTNTIVNAALTVGTADAAGAIGFLSKKGTNGKPDDNSQQKSVATAVTSGLAGTISGFLNGIFGFTKKTTTNEKVSLTLNTNITVNGNSTVSSQLYDNVFAIPGTLNNNQAVPFYPAYNQAMGVFYVDGKPQVFEKLTNPSIILPVAPVGEPDPWHGRKNGYAPTKTYTINRNSFNLVFNPAISSFATISNIKYEVIAFGIQPLIDEINDGSSPYLDITSNQKEDILGYGLVASDPSSVAISNLTISPSSPPSASGAAVRVSLDVVPNDPTAKKQTIVKTFKATVTAN